MDKSHFDPYELSAEAIQEPPATLRRALRKIGPGLILAGTIVGTGELIATTNLGAEAGFTLLWLVILSCFIKVFVQIELGRHAISSGETTLTSFRKLPKTAGFLGWWWLLMLLVTQTQLGAMIGGVGQAFHLALPGASTWLAEQVSAVHSGAGLYLTEHPEWLWAILTVLVTAVLLVRGNYRMIEILTTLLVVVFTIMTVVCVILLPMIGHPLSWGDVASGLTFRIPPEAVMAAFAMIGITGVGASELVSYPYWCIEKGYARNVGPRSESPEWQRRAAGWLRVMRLDAWVSMLIYTVATLAFFLLGAAVLYGHTGGIGLPRTVGGMLNTLAQMYAPVMGAQAATWFILLGVFAVLYSTLFAATAANSRLLTDFLRVNGFIQLESGNDRRWWVRIFCVAILLLGLSLYLLIEDPVLLVTIGGVIQAVTLPMLAAAAIYLRYRRTDRRLTPGRLWDVLLWLSALTLLVVAIYGIAHNMKWIG